jgi:PAS domain S-box-containing protein
MTKTNSDYLPPFLESNLQGIIIFKDGKNIYANPKAIELLEFSSDEIHNFDLNCIYEKIPQQDFEKTKLLIDLYNSKEDFEEQIEFRFQIKSGAVKWFKILARSLTYNDERFVVQNISDITDQKSYELKLIENEKRYKNFIEQTSEGISYLEFKEPLDIKFSDDKLIKQMYRTGYISECNNAFAKMYGLGSREEIVGKRLIDIHGSDNNKANIKAFIDLVRCGYKVQNVVTEEFDFEGNRIYFMNNSVGIIDNGLLYGIWGAQIDITESQKTERNITAAYRISEAANTTTNLDDLYKSIHQIVATLMPAKNFYIALYDKQKNLITFPYFVDEYDEIAPPRKPGNGITEYVLRSGKSLLATPEVISNLRAKGESLAYGAESIDWLGVPLKLKGETIGILAVQSYTEGIRYSQSDIEILEYVSVQVAMSYDRKISEDSLRFSETKNRAIVSAIPDLMFIQNYDGVYLEYHARDKNLLLFEPDIFLGKNYKDVLPIELVRLFDDIIYEVIKTKEIQICKYPLELNGNKHFFEARFITYDEDRILSTIRDITLQEKMMTELVEAKEKAEEMNEIKSNFLANMSHELRTPLHGILGFAQILAEEINDDELQKMANVIYKSGNRLLDTLNLLLNFSKAETSKIETVFSDVIIKNLFDESIELFKPLAESKGLIVSSEISDDNIFLHSDERLLREILNNLINNAIKFTENGGIFLTGTIDDSKNLVFKVKDTGIGIPQNKHEQIFQEFRQESEGLSRNFEGTGLGLTLTKRYVEILGGNISIESEVGIGTTFTIIIPNNIKVENILPNEFKDSVTLNIIPAPASKKRLLLVENDKVSAMLVNTFVKKEYDLDIVANGGEAIKMVSEKEYDAILMDINLGDGITGLDAAQKIKHLKIYKDTPIIAVTAFAMEKDKEEFLKYGCTHYLAKPFEKQDLLQTLKLAFKKD